jgi:hypothetical protein
VPKKDDKLVFSEDDTMEPEIERRSSPRLQTDQPVSIRITQSGHFEFTGTTRDISSDGVFLSTDAELVQGALVVLRLALPSENGQVSMTVRGKVIRVEPPGPDGKTGAAISFRMVELEPLGAEAVTKE